MARSRVRSPERAARTFLSVAGQVRDLAWSPVFSRARGVSVATSQRLRTTVASTRRALD